MDPVTGGKYPYPNGYVSYSNEPGQAVNPATGQTTVEVIDHLVGQHRLTGARRADNQQPAFGQLERRLDRIAPVKRADFPARERARHQPDGRLQAQLSETCR